MDARAAVDLLEELAAAQPTDRRVQRWLGKSLLLRGRLAARRGEPEAARAAWSQAAERLAPHARNSLDGGVLAPWAEVLLHLGRHNEARPILRALRQQGYTEPDLAGLFSDLAS